MILQMPNKDKMLEPKPNSSTTDAGLPSALLAQNPMLAVRAVNNYKP
jgi:hypothetical protein